MARGARPSTAGSATGAVGGGPGSAVAQSGLPGVVVQPGGVHGGRPGHFDRVPLLVLAVTHSPAKAGVVGFAQTLPYLLLYRPAGALIDRWDRKRTMLACDASRAVALGSIAVTVALGWLSMAYVVVVALIEGSLFVLFDLAEGAAMPQSVTDEQVPAAVAQNQAKTQGADLVGQPLGGVLFSIARLLPFHVTL
jgi:MFS family permease